MDGGAAEMTLLGTAVDSRIQTVSESLSVLLFPSFFLYQIKNSGRLVGKRKGGNTLQC